MQLQNNSSSGALTFEFSFGALQDSPAISPDDHIDKLSALLRGMFELSSDAVLIWTDDGRYVDGNPAALRMLGITMDELRSRSVGSFSKEPQRLHRLCQDFRATGRMEGEFRVYHSDGTPIDIEVSGVANVLPGIHLTSFRDIRLRKEQERRQAKYRQFVELAQEGIVMVDSRWNVTLANPALCTMLGYTESEILGRHATEFYFPEDVEDAHRRLESISKGELARVVVRIRRKDGTELWAELSARPVFDRHGDLEGAVGIVVDLSERRESEARLRESEERFKLLASGTHDALWDYDVARDRVWWSEGLNAIAGLLPSEMLSGIAGWEDLIHPDDREWVRKAYRDAVAGSGNSWSALYRFRRRNGTYAHVCDRGFIARDEQGLAKRVLGGMTDISEKIATQQELKESRERLDTAAEALGLGFWDVDIEGGRVVWTPEHAKLFGIDLSEFGGDIDSFVELVHPDDREHVMAAYNRAISTGEQYSHDYRVRHKDGSYHWISARGKAIRDAEGKASRAIGIVFNIDGQKLLEEQLLQAQKLEGIGRLAGGIAHDFNNLLTGVLGYAELAQMTMEGNEKVQGYLSEVTSAATRAADVTRQLLAFARKQVIEPRVVDVNDLTRRLQKMLSRLIGEHVELLTSIEDAPLCARLDPCQLEQVLVNLVVNACDAMPNGGLLQISTQLKSVADGHAEMRPGEYILLTVADTGCGMGAETLEHIYEPFFTTKAPGKGTGLGLATCYGIIKQSGGHIFVHSEPGKGTTFRLLFPIVGEPASEASAVVEAAAARGRDQTVLLVEDEEFVRSFAAAALHQYGYRVLEASNGLEALAVSAEFDGEIDLLITDIVMPKMGGRELADALGATRSPMKVLFMSGYTDDEVLKHGIEHENVAFLQKPFSAGQLVQRVADVLEFARTRTSKGWPVGIPA